MQATREQLSEWLIRFDTARDDERQRLARELHHKVVGSLSAAKMECDWLLRGRRDDEQVKYRLERISDNLVQTIAFTRTVIDRLWPSIVQHLGLATALQQQANDMRARIGPALEANIDARVTDIAEPVAVALYRLVQQVMDAHAVAGSGSPLRLALMQQDDNVVLTIEDDAPGNGNAQKDILLLLQERVRSAGGQATIEQGLQGGRIIRVVVPPTRGVP